jgi:hypothetical protein
MPAAAGATVGALLVAKVVLIADNLPVINRFPEKPLLYNVAWKTTIYVLAALVVHYLEHLVPVWWRVGNVAGERPTCSGRSCGRTSGLFSSGSSCIARCELVRAIGPHEVKRMFFGSGRGMVTRTTREKGATHE